jgi:hypothetical protein
VTVTVLGGGVRVSVCWITVEIVVVTVKTIVIVDVGPFGMDIVVMTVEGNVEV